MSLTCCSSTPFITLKVVSKVARQCCTVTFPFLDLFLSWENKGTHSYDGGVIVRRSIELGEPVIYVSMNYR